MIDGTVDFIVFVGEREIQPKGLQSNEEAVSLSNNFGKVRKQLKNRCDLVASEFVAKLQALVIKRRFTPTSYFLTETEHITKTLHPSKPLQFSVTDRIFI